MTKIREFTEREVHNYTNVPQTVEIAAKGNQERRIYMLERYIMRMESRIRELEKSMAIMEQVNAKARILIETLRDIGVDNA